MGLLDSIISVFSSMSKPKMPSASNVMPIPSPTPTPVVSVPAPLPGPMVTPPPAPVVEEPTVKLNDVGITVAHLIGIQVSPANANKYCKVLNEACYRFNIDKKDEVTAFLAQICEETGNLAVTHEDLYYSSANMMRVWKNTFPTVESTLPYVRNPEALANKVYQRASMGNTNPGDGYKYRGRGFIQLTFKSNYEAAGKALGVDFVSNPDLVEKPEYIALVSAWFWSQAKCNEMAVGLITAPPESKRNLFNQYMAKYKNDPQVDKIRGMILITLAINGGMTNWELRLSNWRKAQNVFSDFK